MIGLYNSSIGVFRIVEDPAVEDLDGWEEVTLPEDYDPEVDRFNGGEFVKDWSFLDTALHTKIDTTAGEIKCRFITAIPGQETTYMLKEREALNWTSETDPDPQLFPYLVGEAEVRGISVDDMATMILTIATQWRYLDTQIEKTRIGAKLAVTLSTTREEKESAAQVDWDALLLSWTSQ